MNSIKPKFDWYIIPFRLLKILHGHEQYGRMSHSEDGFFLCKLQLRVGFDDIQQLQNAIVSFFHQELKTNHLETVEPFDVLKLNPSSPPEDDEIIQCVEALKRSELTYKLRVNLKKP